MKPSSYVVESLSFVLVAALARLLVHVPNATPLAAVAIVGARYLGIRTSILFPVMALFISDVVIGGYDLRIMGAVYGAFLIIGCLGYALRNRGMWATLMAASTSSLIFFFITNAAVWAFSPWYEKSVSGLMYAYELGIPFLRNMLFGDLFYTGMLILAIETAPVLVWYCRAVYRRAWYNHVIWRNRNARF